MSKPRYYWYGIVKRQIMDGGWRDPQSFQEWQMGKAIFEAQKETERLPNGSDRLAVIDAILIKKIKTYDSYDLYVSRPTAQRWVNSFVNLVGRKAGY